jgi:hypothetical protein
MRGLWKWAAYGALICIIANLANAPVGWLDSFAIEKIAKGTAMDAAGRFVNETALNDDRLGTANDFFIDIIGLNRFGKFVSTPGATGRKYDVLFEGRPFNFAGSYEIVNSVGDQPGSVFICGCGKSLGVNNCFQSRFTPSILIFDDDIEALFKLWRGGFCIARANPSPLTSNHIALSRFGAIAGGLGLDASGFSEFSVSFDQLFGPFAARLQFTQLALHGGLLALHNRSLPIGVIARDHDSSYADASGDPQSYGFGDFDPISATLQPERQLFNKAVKAVCAGCLIVGSFVLLGYSLKRTDYLVAVGILGGFLPFALGGFLLLSVFGLIH